MKIHAYMQIYGFYNKAKYLTKSCDCFYDQQFNVFFSYFKCACLIENVCIPPKIDQTRVINKSGVFTRFNLHYPKVHQREEPESPHHAARP